MRLLSGETLTSNKVVGAIMFPGSSAGNQTITLGNYTLGVTSGAIASDGSNNLTISGGTIDFGAAEGIIGHTQAQLTISSTIAGSGGLTIFNTAQYNTLLNNANTYSGTTYIDSNPIGTANTEGTYIGNVAAFGTSTVNVNSGALVNNTGNVNLAIPNAMVFNNSVAILSGSNRTSFTGPVTLVGNNQITAANPTFLAGVVSGSGSLNLISGSLVMQNPNNTYTGGTNVGAANLQVNASDNWTSGGGISSGPLGTGAVNLTGGLTTNYATLQNASTVVSEYVVNSITLHNAITLTNANALIGGNAPSVSNGTYSAAAGAGGDINLGGTVTVTGNSNLNVANGINFTISGNVVGPNGNLIANNAYHGPLMLTGNNSALAGGITVSGGTLVVGSSTALGTGILTLAGGTLQDDGIAARSIANNVVLAAGTSSTVTAINPSLPLTISGVIEGSGNLVDGYTNLASDDLGMNNVQTINFGTSITGGNFTLTVNGATTAAINWDPIVANLVANIQSALAALPPAISNYYLPVVNGTSANAISITFQNVSADAAAAAVPTVMLNGANLAYTGVAISAIAVQTATPTAITETGNVVTVTAANTFTVGQLITVSGVTPAGYNGTYVVQTASGTSFTYTDATASLAAATVFGTATGISTVSTSAAHGFQVGQIVTITGVTPAADNGSFVVTSVPSATTFTYSNTNAGAAVGTVFGSAMAVSITPTFGSGNVVLASPEIYTGTTTVNQGTLTLANNGALVNNDTVNSTQTITLGGTTITGGSFTLTFNGQTTTAIPFFTSATGVAGINDAANVMAASIQTALGALLNVGAGNVLVTATPVGAVYDTVFTVTFVNALGGFTPTLMTAASSLTGTSPTVVVAAGVAGTPAILVNPGASFALDNTATNNVNRLNDSDALGLSGGTFNVLGAASAASTENLGPVVLGPGNSTYQTTAGSGGSLVVNNANLFRNPGAVLNFVAGGAQTLGSASNQVYFTSVPTGSPILTNGIIKGATTTDATSITGTITNTTGFNLASYGTVGVTALGGGLGGVGTYTALTSAATTATTNYIATASTALGQADAVNALLIVGDGVALSGFALTPGEVVAVNTGNTGNSFASTSPLTLGATEGILITANTAGSSGALTLNGITTGTVAAGQVGLTLGGSGTVNFSAVNTETGNVYLDSGNLVLGTGTAVIGPAADVLTVYGGTLSAAAVATIANSMAFNNGPLPFTIGGSNNITETGIFSGSGTLAINLNGATLSQTNTTTQFTNTGLIFVQNGTYNVADGGDYGMAITGITGANGSGDMIVVGNGQTGTAATVSEPAVGNSLPNNAIFVLNSTGAFNEVGGDVVGGFIFNGGQTTVGSGIQETIEDGIATVPNAFNGNYANTINGAGTLKLSEATKAGGLVQNYFNIALGAGADVNNELTIQTPIVSGTAPATGGTEINKLGLGTLVLDGSGANSYTGQTTVNEGTLGLGKLAAGSAVGYGPLVVGNFGSAAAAVVVTPFNQLSISEGISVSPGGATEAGNTVTITAGTAGTNGFKVGQVVTVAGVGVGGYNGTWVVTASTINGFSYYDGTTGLANSGGGTASGNVPVIVNNGGTFDISDGNTITTTQNIDSLDLRGASVNTNGALLSPDNTITGLANGVSSSISGLLALTANQTINTMDVGGTPALSLAAVISGAFSLTKADPGTLTLSGSNTYTGTTTVNGGTLALANTSGTAVPGNLVIGDTLGGQNASKADVVRLLASNQIATTSAVTINASGLLDLNGNTNTIGLGAVNGLTITGGSVTTGAGTLVLDGNVAALALTTNLTPATITGNLDLGGGVRVIDVQPGTLAGQNPNGTAENPGVAISNTDDMVIAAVISDGSLTKTDGGSLELSGTNTYTGATSINGGRLFVDGSLNAASAVTVNSASTLGGTGTVNGPVVVLGSTVSPGDPGVSTNGIGILTVGSVNFSQGGNLNIAVSATSGAGTNYDQLVVLGNTNLGGTSTLTVNVAGLLSGGTVANVVSTGTFSGTPTGTFSSTILTNNPNGFSVTPSYQPSSLSLLISAVTTVTTVTASQPSVQYGTAVTFTATVSATSGTTAPGLGSVDFYDTTTGQDLGNGIFGGSSGTASTWTITTGVKTFNATLGDVITASYTPGTNFNSSSNTMTEVVTPLAITVTAAVSSKTYDGTTSSTAAPALTGGSLVAGDTAAFSEVYGTKNVGSGLSLNATGSVNDGNGGNNYTVTVVNSTAGVIGTRALVVTASANSKVYDGSTSAAASPTINVGSLATNDTAAFTESYASKNAGTGEVITSGGSVNDGNGGSNYTVTFLPSVAGTITRLAITVTATAASKVYDGTTASTATPSVNSGGVASGDTAAFSETYGTRNAGTGLSLSAAGSVNDGNGGSNYTVSYVANTAGIITARAITVSATTNTKVYDGTNAATATPTVSGGLGAGDTAAFSETYGTKNVGTGLSLSAAGSVNDGNNGSNYTVTLTPITTGVIAARAITVSAMAVAKTYDGTASTSALPLVTGGSLATGDTAAFSESFTTRNVGVGLTLVPAGSVSDGNSGSNYAVSLVNNTAGAIIARSITVTAASNTKAYDGTAAASATPTITGGSLASGDSASFGEAYLNKNAGTGLSLLPTGSVNDANGGANYSVTFQVNTTGQITARAITVTANDDYRQYDGFTDASASPSVTSGTLATGDTAAFTESFSSKNAQVENTLNPAGSANDGNGGNNYTVTWVSDTGIFISPKVIGVTAVASSKVYDGTTTAAATPTISSGSLVGGDVATWSESYASKNVGTGLALTPTGGISDGNGGSNYHINFNSSNTGQITQRFISVNAVTNTKSYDGTTSAAATPTIAVGSLATGDTLAFTETYNTKDVGTGLTLTPAGSVNDGNGGSDYVVYAWGKDYTGVITASQDVAYFQIVATPTAVLAGQSFIVGVTAENAANQQVTSYGGTVTLGSVNTVGGASGAVPGGPVTLSSGFGYCLATLTTAGVWNITATDNGSPAHVGVTTTPVTVTPAAASKVVFETGYQPTSTFAGATMSTVKVNVDDQYGNIVTSYASNVTAAIASGPSNGQLLGTTTMAAVGGVATFNTLSIDQAGTYTMSASGAGVGGVATSSSFPITPGSATQLAFTTPPASTPGTGTLLGSVGISAASWNSTSQVVSITTSAAHNLSNGAIVTVTGISPTTYDGTFTVTVTSPTTFTYAMTDNPNPYAGGGTVGVPVAVAVAVEDQYGNTVTSDTSNVSLSLNTLSGDGALGGTQSANAVAGVATFSTLSITRAGSYTLTASDSNNSLTAPTSPVFNTTFVVTNVAWTPTGFVATFSQPFDPTQLNLYGSPSTGSLPANVTLENSLGKTVRGSLVMNSTDTQLTFVATTLVAPSGLPVAGVSVPGAASGILPTGTYQLIFTSGNSALTTPTGQLLDGNDSGAGGNAYVVNKAFTLPTVAVVLPAFARGPGNTVNVTNASASIAATVSSSATATETGTTATITTTSSLGLQIGESVTITGMSKSAYNNTFVVKTVPNSTTFTITATTGTGSATGGTVTLYGISESGSTVTVNTAAQAALVANEPVTLSGVSINGYNGLWKVATVTNNYSFTFTAATTGLGTASGGTFAASRGIPISLSNADGIKSGEFTISFDPTMLNVTGVTIDPSLATSYPGSSLILNVSKSSLGSGVAVIDFNSGTNALPNSGAIVLGGLTGSVPSAAYYNSKDLLQVSGVSLSNAGGSIASVAGGSALHLVSYLGNASGTGSFTSADTEGLTQVLAGGGGFAAYPLVNPYIVGNIVGAGAINSTDQSDLGKYVGGSVVAQMPTYPVGGPTNFATGPDPTLSIPSTLQVGSDGRLVVPVNIDDPRPAGSEGMTEATLALTYDPTIFSVSSSDIHLGSVPASGSGWSLQSVVDAATGQIGVTIWSSTPISSSAAGSLVTIDFHQSGLVAAGTTTIDLVSSVDPKGLSANGLGVIHTQVDDAHGPYTLTPAPTNAYDPQIDGLVSLAAAAAATGSASSAGSHTWPVTVASTPLTVLPHLAASVVAGLAAADGAGAAATFAAPASSVGPSSYLSASSDAAQVPQQLADGLFTALARGAVDPAELASLGSVADRAVSQALAAQVSAAGSAQANLDRLLWGADGESDWLGSGGQSSAVQGKRERPQGSDVSVNE